MKNYKPFFALCSNKSESEALKVPFVNVNVLIEIVIDVLVEDSI